ncbi:MAG: RICIN domain-containing protein [Lachnospiraceae bacterium]|jgi:N-acetylmuramoyl-L-alanine amidase
MLKKITAILMLVIMTFSLCLPVAADENDSYDSGEIISGESGTDISDASPDEATGGSDDESSEGAGTDDEGTPSEDSESSDDSTASDTSDEEMSDALELMPAEVSEGYYFIHSVLDSKKVVDIYAGSTASGANVQIYTKNGTNAQKFYIKGLGDGSYSIQNAGSGLYLEVAGSSPGPKSNVIQGTKKNSNSQKWYIKKNSAGEYTFVSALGNYALDIYAAKSDNYTNIWLYYLNNTGAQRFTLEKAPEPPKAEISDGTFIIRAAGNRNSVLEVAGSSNDDFANIRLGKYSGASSQKFVFTQIENGYYMISNLGSSKAVDAYAGGKTNGTNVDQYTSNGTSAQKWIVSATSDGYIMIENAESRLALDCYAAQTEPGTNIWLYKKNNTMAQKFVLESVDEERNFPDAMYTIRMKSNKNFVLDIYGGYSGDGVNLQVYRSNGTNAQKFTLRYSGGGYYKIVNVSSGKVLTVEGGSSASGTNVCQSSDSGSPSQKWKLVPTGDGDGSYFIRSSLGNVSLDVYGSVAENGRNVWSYTANKTDAQKFFLSPTVRKADPKPKKVIEIDPGHASKANTGTEQNGPGSSVYKMKFTSGTQGNTTGLAEHALNLSVSLKLKSILEQRGYTVYMTRTTADSTISNKERTLKAKTDGADILVHIHANSSSSSSVKGVMNIAPANNNPYLSSSLISKCQTLANTLADYQCKKTGQVRRSVQLDNTMTGLNWAVVPTCIVEMGFMSNPSEDVYMANSANQTLIATGIADGIDAYFSKNG